MSAVEWLTSSGSDSEPVGEDEAIFGYSMAGDIGTGDEYFCSILTAY